VVGRDKGVDCSSSWEPSVIPDELLSSAPQAGKLLLLWACLMPGGASNCAASVVMSPFLLVLLQMMHVHFLKRLKDSMRNRSACGSLTLLQCGQSHMYR
jgi:hypothetical protein